VTQRVLDVSGLEIGTADSRSLLWWGNLGMMAIEGTMFAMLIASYLYLRVVNLDWPPSSVPKPALVWPTIDLALLIATLIPTYVLDRAALRDDVKAVKVCLAICVVVGISVIAIRFYELMHLGFKWSDHAYGSVVWSCIGFHLFHMFAATGETGLLLVYSHVRPIVKKQLLDFRCLAVYWTFVIVSWMPFYAIIFVLPWGHRKG